jgi:hypothetical protein
MDKDALRIDRLRLTHGQARWVLNNLGIHAGEDQQRFDALIKSLRRDGVPFAPEELGVGAGHNLAYRYEHLMELAVALAWRTQGILSRHIVGLMAQYRSRLRPLYHKAWLERSIGVGAPRSVVIDDNIQQRISGTYLDLSLTYNETGMPRVLEPRLLNPVEAFRYYMAGHSCVYPRPPLPISQYAIDIVRLAEDPPEIKRGRLS